MKNIIGFAEGNFPANYLGLPLSPVYPKTRHFSSLIDKCRSKLEGWSMHTLSFSGRVELIKSVIQGIIAYWVQSFNFPVSICNELDKLCANFMGKGRLHAWKCDAICRPKSEGGMGLRRTREISQVATLKRLWNYCTSSSVWAS